MIRLHSPSRTPRPKWPAAVANRANQPGSSQSSPRPPEPPWSRRSHARTGRVHPRPRRLQPDVARGDGSRKANSPLQSGAGRGCDTPGCSGRHPTPDPGPDRTRYGRGSTATLPGRRGPAIRPPAWNRRPRSRRRSDPTSHPRRAYSAGAPPCAVAAAARSKTSPAPPCATRAPSDEATPHGRRYPLPPSPAPRCCRAVPAGPRTGSLPVG